MEHLTDAPVANILILAGIIFLAVGIFGRVGGFIGSIFGNIEAGKNSRVLAGTLGLLLILGGGWMHEGNHKSPGANPSPTTPASSTSPGANPSPAAAASSTSPGANPSPAATASTTAPASNPSPATAAPSRSPASSTSHKGTTSPSVAPDVPREVPKAKAPAAQPAPLKTMPPAAPEAATPRTARDNSPTLNPPVVGDDRLVGLWTNLTPQADNIKRLQIVRVGQALDAHIWYSCPLGECDQGVHRLHISGNIATYDITAGDRRRLGTLKLHNPAVLLLTVDILETGTQHRWHHNWVLVKSTLSEKTQSAFARYLIAPNQKAFAMAPGGAWSYRFKEHSAAAAGQVALQNCEKSGMPGCRIILLNNDAPE